MVRRRSVEPGAASKMAVIHVSGYSACVVRRSFGYVVLVAVAGCNAIAGLESLDFAQPQPAAGHGGEAGGGSPNGGGGAGAIGGGGGDGGSAGEGGRAPSYSALVFADGALAYWRFDDLAPPTAIDSVGTHDGDIIGGVTLMSEGAIAQAGNTAACFDGTDDRVVIEDVFDFIDTAPFTFEVWVKPLSTRGSYTGILCKDDFDVEGFQGQQILWNDGDLYFERASDGHQDLLFANGSAPVGSYHHVVVTYDTINLVLYIDAMERTNLVTSFPVLDLEVPLVLGARSSQGGNFEGCLDEVAIYGSALTEAQVESHYLAGIGTP
jgi:hypothetical protein